MNKPDGRSPARVYAAPLEIYRAARIDIKLLETTLESLGYRATKSLTNAGQYRKTGDEIRVFARAFTTLDGDEPERQLRIKFLGNRIRSVTDVTGAAIPIARLEPVEIGTIHPGVFEDRTLIDISTVPKSFVDNLLAVEDRRFHTHPVSMCWEYCEPQ